MTWALTDEQVRLRQRAREVARDIIEPRAMEVDAEEAYPWDNVTALQEAGFTGMTVPERFGGPGRSFLDAILVVEEMAKVCGVTGRIAVECNMGAISAVMAYGTDQQRDLAASLVLAGDKPAICITEPEAGSAASQMTTRADRVADGYVLNGKKHWITGGTVSRLHLIFARVFDESGTDQGIAGFLAVRDEAAGLRFGRREPTLGLRAIPETEVLFEDMFVEDAMVVMPPSGMRRGFADLMNAYNAQRVGAGTVALGLAQGAYERAVAFAKTREQFGRPIAEFQGLQWMLADMSVKLEAARSLTYRAAASRGPDDSPFPDPALAAQAKIFTAEAAIEVVSDALQMHGAAGYSRRLPLERMYRDVRMFTIGGGTAQILRTVVASRLLDMRLPQTRDGYVRQRPMTAPLDGVIVVSVEQAVAAPFATRQLADLGARVLKVERPGSGDFARDYDTAVEGSSAFFVWANRGKDSIELDIKSDEGRRQLETFIAGADVFVQNLAPAAAARAGLLAHQVRERHPLLVACGISGYGLDGPRTDDKAYDLAIQAEAGAISLTGSADAPSKVGFSVADISSAMYALSSILAALYRRSTEGSGATIEVSMLESLAEWTAAPTYGAVARGVIPARAGHRHAMIAPYGVYRLQDGNEILIAVQNNREWQALCDRVLERPALASDPRFETNEARIANIDDLEVVLEAALAAVSPVDARARLSDARIAVAEVNDPMALWNHDQLRSRDRFVHTELPGGAAETYRAPFNIDGAAGATPVVPGLGEHDAELVGELRRRAEARG